MFCEPFTDLQFFVFTSHVPQLLYYSHIPTAVIALIVGTYVFVKTKHSLEGSTLLALAIVFSLWCLFNLLAWTNPDSRDVLLLWSFFPVIYISIFLLSYYFYYTFLFKQDVPFFTKIVFLTALLPILFVQPTNIHLESFDTVICEAVENGLFVSYYYILSVIIFFWIMLLGAIEFVKRDRVEKRKIALLTFGVGFFLLFFFASSAWASYIDNFELEQYGLFGVVVFLVLLAYLIVRYKAFDIKLIGSHALTVALVIIIASQFTYSRSLTSYILNSVALILVIITGYFLAKSVSEEVRKKEELEKLSKELSKANEKLTEMDKQKSEFISIASHQLRTPLTAIKGYVSLLLEGSYGVLKSDVTDVLNKVYSVNDRLAHLVEDLLNVSRIEAGRIQYNFQPTQLADILTELHDMFLMPAKNKNLDLKLNLPDPALPKIVVDPNKIKEISSNLIDNAIKYTPSGSVSISLSQVGPNARIEIADTGIGIKPEDKEHLFTKFVRSKETARMVVGGAGLGLFVGKSFVLAHKGNIWAESDGPGTGSKFIIELPIINPGLEIGTIDKQQEA